MKKLVSVILSVAILLSLGLTSFAESTNDLMQRARLTVGVNAEFFPFEYCEGEELKGFDIELMQNIGEKIGFEIEFINMPFDQLIPAVINGEVACSISAISATKERESAVDFTTPYLSMGEYDNYAIVFPENYRQKAQLAEAAGQAFIYGLVDEAIKELIADDTVESLREKYELDKHFVVDDEEIKPAEDDLSNNDTSSTANLLETPPAPPSDWAADSVIKAQELGITEKGKFYYNKRPISREEFCELIYNYCANVVGVLEPTQSKSSFTDTDNAHIKILNVSGIINGKSETEFAPNASLTREEAATILNRMIHVAHPDSVSTELYFAFADEAKIADWAMSSIQRICNMGIMQGVGDNRFAPQELYTSEQAVVTLVRVYSRFALVKQTFDDEFLLVSSDDIEYKLNSDISSINKNAVSKNEGRGDGFHWIEHSYHDVFVKALITDDETTNIIHISTSSGDYKTARGVKVGDSLQKLQEAYTEDLRKTLSDEVCYIFEPPMVGFNRIYFYFTNDIITKIVIENGIDG